MSAVRRKLRQIILQSKMVLFPFLGRHTRCLSCIKLGCGKHNQRHVAQWMWISETDLVDATKVVMKVEPPSFHQREDLSESPQVGSGLL
jgi:hypothetical protein